MKRLIVFTIVSCMLLLPACVEEAAVQEWETETTVMEATTEAAPAGEYPVPSDEEIDDMMLQDAHDAYDQYMMEMMEQEDAQYPANY